MELYRAGSAGSARPTMAAKNCRRARAVLCEVELAGLPGTEGADGPTSVLVPDADLTARDIREGDTVLLAGGTLQKGRPIRTSALIGLGRWASCSGGRCPGCR